MITLNFIGIPAVHSVHTLVNYTAGTNLASVVLTGNSTSLKFDTVSLGNSGASGSLTITFNGKRSAGQRLLDGPIWPVIGTPRTPASLTRTSITR